MKNNFQQANFANINIETFCKYLSITQLDFAAWANTKLITITQNDTIEWSTIKQFVYNHLTKTVSKVPCPIVPYNKDEWLDQIALIATLKISRADFYEIDKKFDKPARFMIGRYIIRYSRGMFASLCLAYLNCDGISSKTAERIRNNIDFLKSCAFDINLSHYIKREVLQTQTTLIKETNTSPKPSVASRAQIHSLTEMRDYFQEGLDVLTALIEEISPGENDINALSKRILDQNRRH